MAQVVELKPNKDLVQSDFDGYKLSLEEIRTNKVTLPVPVLRALLLEDQYSYKHAKLSSLHNHLTCETYGDIDILYYIAEDRHIYKMLMEPYGMEFDETSAVWKVPQVVPCTVYNLSFGFPSEDLVLIADGASSLYIIESGSRMEQYPWKTVLSDSFPFSFIIESCVYNEPLRELHCVLHDIMYEDKCHKTCLYWVKYKRVENDWERVSTMTFKSKGELHYAALEKSCDAICVACEHPFIEDKSKVSTKKYAWTQNTQSVTLKCKIPNGSLKVTSDNQEISVSVDDIVVLTGKLYSEVDNHSTMCNDDLLEIGLLKKDKDVTWDELIVGNNEGEFVADDDLFMDFGCERLAHLCGEAEVLSTDSSILNYGQMEECDFPSSTTSTIERITDDGRASHRVNLGSEPVLFKKQISRDSMPVLAIHQNDDVCLWQPDGLGSDCSWVINNIGTLMKFGYVQASKQRKKYLTCSPDLSYSAILESNRHMFIYRQNKTVSSGELRNRALSKRVLRVAQQQIISITDNEIVGHYSSNRYLFIMSTSAVYILCMS